MRQRIDQILAKLDGPLTGERLRAWRAIEVLEKIGTPDAQNLLKELAGGAPEAGVTQDALEALDRLASAHRPKVRSRRSCEPGGCHRSQRLGHKGGRSCIAYSSDGQTLAIGGKDQAVRLWDLTARDQ
jgi:hypothetical protein